MSIWRPSTDVSHRDDVTAVAARTTDSRSHVNGSGRPPQRWVVDIVRLQHHGAGLPVHPFAMPDAVDCLQMSSIRIDKRPHGTGRKRELPAPQDLPVQAQAVPNAVTCRRRSKSLNSATPQSIATTKTCVLTSPMPTAMVAVPAQKPAVRQPMPNSTLPTTWRRSVWHAVGDINLAPNNDTVRRPAAKKANTPTAMAPAITSAGDVSQAQPRSRKPGTLAAGWPCLTPSGQAQVTGRPAKTTKAT